MTDALLECMAGPLDGAVVRVDSVKMMRAAVSERAVVKFNDATVYAVTYIPERMRDKGGRWVLHYLYPEGDDP